VAPADNQTMVVPSGLEHLEEKSDEEGGKQQCPSNAVVVRDGDEVLVPLSSLQSDEDKSSGENDSAVVTHLCSKDKKAEKSQKTKKKKQPALAPSAQKGTPRAAAAESAQKITPTATSEAVLQKIPAPAKTSS
jgi:hypothetical protein